MCCCAYSWRSLGCSSIHLVSALSQQLVPPPWGEATGWDCSQCQGGPSLPWVLLPAPGPRVPTASCSLSWQDRRSSDLCQCCGIWAAYNGFVDLHRHMLTLLGKNDSTAPMLVKMLEQNSQTLSLAMCLCWSARVGSLLCNTSERFGPIQCSVSPATLRVHTEVQRAWLLTVINSCFLLYCF